LAFQVNQGFSLGKPLPLIPQKPGLFALPIAFFGRFALVRCIFALGERDFDLRAAAIIEIDLQWYNRHALALHRADKLIDLTAMEEQLPWPLGFVIELMGFEIFGNIGVDQKELAILLGRV